jgi:heparan-alpha-glucosaminide N-acetyltransferase
MQATLPRTAGAADSPPQTQKPTRNLAVDTYRGFVMLLMMAEVLQLSRVFRNFPTSRFWSFLAYHQSHVAWAGCSLHDTIQPGFSFLVGVAVPYSIASRIAKGGTFGRMLLHAVWRSFLLIALGVFLRSIGRPQTYFTFEDTLSQIGLGYTILFLLAFQSPRRQWIALGVILVGYWAWWALYPAPSWAAHWFKEMNAGVAFDRWFLNLFPRVQPFVNNGGGYLTSSFIPTLGTMLLGLIAGQWLRAAAPRIPFRKFLIAAAATIAGGLLLHVTGINPVVKRIWTPAWTLYSGGLCFLFLAGFCWMTEVKGWRRAAYPLVVIGMNSMAAYMIAHLWERFVIDSFRIHLGPQAFQVFGVGLEPLIRGMAVLAVFWVILWWMHRRKLYLKV